MIALLLVIQYIIINWLQYLTTIGLTAYENPCDDLTCYNGGNCKETPAGKAECVCAPGYDGPQCKLGNYGWLDYDEVSNL